MDPAPPAPITRDTAGIAVPPHMCALHLVRAVERGVALPVGAERGELLRSLHAHWSRQLLCRIDAALEVGSDSPAASVALAWRSAVRDQPRVHRVLEAEAANPVLRAGRRSLFAAVAVAAGQATFDDPVARRAVAGERFLASLAQELGGSRRPTALARLLRRIWDGGPEPDPYPWAA